VEKRKSQADHDRIVARLAEFFRREGFSDIRADVEGYPKPDKIYWPDSIKGHVPDVLADWALVEVETEDSIEHKHTEDQWTLFSAYALEHNLSFYVVVPAGREATAKARVQELRVKAEVWPI